MSTQCLQQILRPESPTTAANVSFDQTNARRRVSRFSGEPISGVLIWSLVATLIHTLSPMAGMTHCLGASEHERALVPIPIGWPHPNAAAPDHSRKPPDDILTFR